MKTIDHARRLRRRRLATAGLVAGAGAAASVPLGALPASAAKTQCGGDQLCEWEDGGFNSSFRSWSKNGADSDYRNNTYGDGAGLNDSISAVWNNSDRWVKLFQDVGNAGYTLCLGPGMAVSDLHTLQMQLVPPQNWGNRISGHATYASQPSGCDTVINDPNHAGCSL